MKMLVIVCAVFVAIGIGMLVTGATMSSAVTCGSQVMQPGDKCLENREDAHHFLRKRWVSYEEKKSGAGPSRVVAFVGGTGCLVVGLFPLVLLFLARTRRDNQPPATEED